jgi:asparagine synthase (glutamine-hydrolysing)
LGDFLVVIFSKGSRHEADRLFRAGLEVAHAAKGQVPSQTVEMEWVYAASFPRLNGSGTPIVVDPETDSWLMAIGTWFHVDGYGVGSEARLLGRYLEVGSHQLAQELEGFFVIVVGDAKVKETIVFTDIVGSCHGFLRSWKSITALSSSSLLLAGLEDFSLDPSGCQEFLCTGIVYEDRTFYREVHKLGPATLSRFAEGTLRDQRRYWQIRNITPDSLDGSEAARRLWAMLIDAAHKIGKIFTQPVCDLTGGYDSRVLVAAFLTAGVHFSTTVSGLPEAPDVVLSQGLAKMLGLHNMHLEPPAQTTFDQVKKAFLLTDGEYDLIEYARIFEIHRLLSQHFHISINGSYGEVARGYWWELLFPHAGARRKLNSEKVARLRYGAQTYAPSIFSPELRLDLVSHLADVIERTNAGLTDLPNTLQMDHAYLMMRMQRWQGRIASSTNRLWPCLSPFLFRTVLETMLQSSTRIRRRGLLIRRMLNEFQPRLADFPLEHGYPAMPATWRNFHRFWPLPVYFGKRILSKLIGVGGGSRGTTASRSGRPPARLQLWAEEDVRDLLHPETMKLSPLVDPTALADFLRHSREDNFRFNGQWSRVLSLEYTLNVLDRAKIRPKA